MFEVRRRTVLGAGAGAAALSVLPRASVFAKSEKPVRIGLIESLTGTYADVARSDVEGSKLAVEEINAKGGILGRPVELFIEDDGTSPSLGVQKAHKLINLQKVDLLTGTDDSAVALAVSQAAHELNTIFMCTAAHTDAVTGSRCNWCTFRTCTTTWMLAAGNSRLLFDKFGKRWYFITPDYAFGHTEHAAYAEQLKSYGGKELGNALFPVGTTDFSSYLVSAKLAHPDVLMVLGIGQDKVNCLKQATQFGLNKIMAIGGGEINVEEIVALPQAARYGWWTMEWYWNQPKTPFVEQFVESYKKHYKGKYPTARSYLGHTAIHSLALGVEKAKSLESLKVARALEGLVLPPEVALQPGQAAFRAGDHQLIANEFPGEVLQGGKYPNVFQLAAIVPGAKIAKSVSADGCELVYPS